MLNALPPRLFADIHTEDELGTAVRLNTHLLLFFKRVVVVGGTPRASRQSFVCFPRVRVYSVLSVFNSCSTYFKLVVSVCNLFLVIPEAIGIIYEWRFSDLFIQICVKWCDFEDHIEGHLVSHTFSYKIRF